ncbi:MULTISPECIES: glutathione S-transferase N-terminal domain-containing protein [Methylomonas]|uniref:Glutathione S-transferase N-terminal domain-containing protein n=1 Tax=Methylomonas defluvii TaxID=3045149 RepID=A0ABU4UFH0_9GAMM|nr:MULTISPECIES: glutathione S-transferase N-terminal domain-containing protein [unclassified Methylomonas]MDX8128237.1 glutathione S-transferase N-terminal domain-containing protein [Methylomonas sp. OY6]
MTLFSSPACIMSHCARLVVYEKGVPAEVEFFDPNDPPEDLLELNPNGNAPTFVERDLVLYDARIIMEYLDERFPHPALHQMDPVSRANARMLIKRIDQEWYPLLDDVLVNGDKKAAKAKKQLRESLLAAAPVFEATPYFMSDEYSLIDCAMAPFLWRLPSIGIDIAGLGKGITAYANRLFSRRAFQESLSREEKDMMQAPSK